MGMNLTFQSLTKKLIDTLIIIKLIGTDIQKHLTTVWDNIMLSTRMYYCNSHLCWTKQRTDFFILIITYECQIIQRFINSIHAFISICMPRYPMRNNVANHKSFFSYSWLHSCRFTNYSDINLRQ